MKTSDLKVNFSVSCKYFTHYVTKPWPYKWTSVQEIEYNTVLQGWYVSCPCPLVQKSSKGQGDKHWEIFINIIICLLLSLSLSKNFRRDKYKGDISSPTALASLYSSMFCEVQLATKTCIEVRVVVLFQAMLCIVVRPWWPGVDLRFSVCCCGNKFHAQWFAYEQFCMYAVWPWLKAG